MIEFLFSISCSKGKESITEIQNPSGVNISNPDNNTKNANLKIEIGEGTLVTTVGKVTYREIKVKNYGSIFATGITSSDIISPFSVEKNNCSTKLDSNEECTVKLKFSPMTSTADDM